MRKPVIAVTGISGVGKTTFLRRLAEKIDFQCLHAGALIKEGREAFNDKIQSADALRQYDHDENQTFLVRGFEMRADKNAPIIILDSHTVIERDGELTKVLPNVFSAVGIQGMIFLSDDLTKIAGRRKNDIARNRPSKNAEELDAVQEAALAQAELICGYLDIPLHVFNPQQHEQIMDIVVSFNIMG